MFSELTIEKIGYYVYYLVNPLNNSVFYVGKGTGNRVFSHALGNLKTIHKSDKIDTIREIINKGSEVQHNIIRYGLTEKESIEVEAALIDFIGLDNLANIVKGHNSDRGKISCKELEIQYAAKEIIVKHNLLAVILRDKKINILDLNKEELYERSRKAWRIDSSKISGIDYVIATHNGIVREVYKPEKWNEIIEGKSKRKEFQGNIADESIRNLYIYSSIANKMKKGHQNSIMYLYKNH